MPHRRRYTIYYPASDTVQLEGAFEVADRFGHFAGIVEVYVDPAFVLERPVDYGLGFPAEFRVVVQGGDEVLNSFDLRGGVVGVFFRSDALSGESLIR